MPRKKLEVTKPDETGFTTKLKQGRQAPKLALGGRGKVSAPSKPKETTSDRKPQSSGSEKSTTLKKPAKPKKVVQSAPEPVAPQKLTKENSKTTQLRLYVPAAHKTDAEHLAASIGVSVQDLLKLAIKNLLVEIEGKSIEPVQIEEWAGEGQSERVRIAVPVHYEEAYRKKLDPLGLASLADIGKSMVHRAWVDCFANTIKETKSRFNL